MLKKEVIDITIGLFRNDLEWKRKSVQWSEFVSWLKEGGKFFVRTPEKYKEYLKLPKPRQDEIKDVGGFVGGILSGGRRKKQAVLGRSLVTLDIDNMTPQQGAQFWKTFEYSYDCAAVLYSTHKHSPDTPRFRLIIPLDKLVEPDQYFAIARRIAGDMDIEIFDDTGFQAERLMYWPSCAADGQFVFHEQKGRALDSTRILDTYGIGPEDDLNAREGLTGWRDSSQWPVSSKAKKAVHKSADIQGDPTEKQGIVGAFCRTFPILEAIETFLPNVYLPVEGVEDRYSYAAGSTSGGAIVYRDEVSGRANFLYSHHGTDPINGRLVNAFDLVRIHKFGIKDDGKEDETDVTKLPSYEHMREYAARNKAVAAQIVQDRRESAREWFKDVYLTDEQVAHLEEIEATEGPEKRVLGDPPEKVEKVKAKGAGGQTAEGVTMDEHGQEIDENGVPLWCQKLDISQKGAIRSTISNVTTILENDPNFKDRIFFDEFRTRCIIRNRLPWRRIKEYSNQWKDSDNAALRHYLEKVYQISGKEKIEDGLQTLLTKKAFNPVKDFLKSLEWDGVERVDRVLIDYLGADDTEYVRTVTRKALVAAVTRVMRPGIKFDNVLVLVGEEGKMKSMLFDHLANPWFSDTFITIQGKEAFEQIHGFWIIEIGELSALNKAESSQIKQYLGKRVDSYRAPWGRGVQDYPRQNIFVATTNDEKFLKGIGGDRRFWPVDIDVVAPLYSVASLKNDRATVEQIWAEAMQAFRDGYRLDLSEKMFYTAREVQQQHTLLDARSETIRDFLEMDLPVNWYELDYAERRMYVRGELVANGKDRFVRDKVCVREVWTDCFGKSIGDLTRRDSDAITHTLNHMKKWVKSKSPVRIPGYPGVHRGWVKKE